MRITKKFTGASCIGKRVFHPRGDRNGAGASELGKAKEELANHEARWRQRLLEMESDAAGKSGIKTRRGSGGGSSGGGGSGGAAVTNHAHGMHTLVLSETLTTMHTVTRRGMREAGPAAIRAWTTGMRISSRGCTAPSALSPRRTLRWRTWTCSPRRATASRCGRQRRRRATRARGRRRPASASSRYEPRYLFHYPRGAWPDD
mmetsp:Transcript_34981/g.109976  ORF Transcript_34981/g.109976 Transcript_34981/m.109976 type:complete len:203 (-) Transcript_34981:122-730(-)